MIADLLGIALIVAVIWLVYYLHKNKSFLRSKKGWTYLAIGFSLYIPRVILTFFYKISYDMKAIEFARFSLSLGIIFFIALGMWKLREDLKIVRISILRLAYAKYIIAGIVLFLFFLVIRASSYFYVALSSEPYWSIARTFLLESVLMIMLSLRRIYLVLGPKAKNMKAIITAGDIGWLREDTRVLMLYKNISDMLIAGILPIFRGLDLAQKTLERCAGTHEILRYCSITEGALKIEPAIKYLSQTEEKNTSIELYDAFSCLNTRFIDLYSAITSPEKAVELVQEAENWINALGKTHVPFDNDLVYRHRILFGMPHGIAENGKARTFVFILFKEVFEPMLERCKPSTISNINSLEIAKDLDLSEGKIGLSKLFKRINKMHPNEWTNFVASTFKKTMDELYPLLIIDLGNEYVDNRLISFFSDLFKQHGDLFFKYEFIEAIPDNLQIPELKIFKLFNQSHSYLIQGKPEMLFQFIKKLNKSDPQGLILTRTPPEHLREKYGIVQPMIWLTHIQTEYCIEPTNITKLTVTILDYIRSRNKGVILVEGLEYLIVQNGFEAILRFIESIKDHIALSKSRLFVLVDERTLSKKQLFLLQRELEPYNAETI